MLSSKINAKYITYTLKQEVSNNAKFLFIYKLQIVNDEALTAERMRTIIQR